jgi:hypothetical protein
MPRENACAFYGLIVHTLVSESEAGRLIQPPRMTSSVCRLGDDQLLAGVNGRR